MATLEIKNDISNEKINMVINVLKALGITAVINKSPDTSDDTAFSKKEFTEKIQRARKSPKIKVSASEQSKLLGL